LEAIQIPLGAYIADPDHVSEVVTDAETRLAAIGGAIATKVIAGWINVTQIRKLRVVFYLRVSAGSLFERRKS
jgi:endonuclease V-like protein UPF0215 family